jgi:polysaccharide export outer membrane protein
MKCITQVTTLLALVQLVAAAPRAAEPALSAQQIKSRASSEYVIGAFDKIRVSVFEMKELDLLREVTEEGTISLPLLGEIHVGGLTPNQAQEAIAEMLRSGQLVKNPQVSVQIEEYVSRRINVTGAVSTPGRYVLLGNKTLIEMLAEAGGLNERAGKKIFIDRPMASGETRIQVDAERLMFENDPAANLPLQPGDVIYVPYRAEITVYVNGEVRQAGAVRFSRDEPVTVLRAVTSAGGGTERANESRVKVLRRLEDGTQQTFKVNLKQVKRGSEEDLILQNNDIVVVPTSFF